jgi:putative addiction module antidote
VEYGKLRKAGNSLAVTIPKEEVERQGLVEGDTVVFTVRKAVVRPVLSPELRAIAERVMERDAEALRYLADR